MPRSESRATAVAAALLVLLVLLATFQYRWLGQIADAERHELQARVDDAAHRIAGDFDRELRRAFVQFLVDPRAGRTAADSLPLKARVWRSSAQHPELIAAFFMFSPESGASRLDEETGELRPTDWPDELRGLADSLEAEGGERHPARLIAQGASALVVPIRPSRPDLRNWGATILQLDREVLVAELLPELIATHLGDEAGGDFEVAVVELESRRVIHRSTQHAPLSKPPADAAARMFGLGGPDGFSGLGRPDPRSRRSGGVRPPDGPAGHGERRPPSDFTRPRSRRGGGRPRDRVAASAAPRWEILITHRAGSLDAVVARARTRNLVVSGGVLLLLAGSLVFLTQSNRRAHRLAKQQLEFVAGISHELNTPLAAIRSSGENLADGVVTDPGRVREYGVLIRREERRLSGLVEQVLDYAGLRSGRDPVRDPVDMALAVGAALEDAETEIASAGCEVEVSLDSGLPNVVGDPAALRRAARNVISNAVKYGGGWVRVSVFCEDALVVVRVEDRGPGIPGVERRRVFEPFYRGRSTASNVPGTGLGLSIVKDIVDSHGGKIAIRGAEGCVIELRLPAVPVASA